MMEAKVSKLDLTGKWNLNWGKQQLTYPSNIDTIENEPLEFPVVMNKKSRKNVSLLKLSKQLVLEDCFDKIEFVN